MKRIPLVTDVKMLVETTFLRNSFESNIVLRQNKIPLNTFEEYKYGFTRTKLLTCSIIVLMYSFAISSA